MTVGHIKAGGFFRDSFVQVDDLLLHLVKQLADGLAAFLAKQGY